MSSTEEESSIIEDLRESFKTQGPVHPAIKTQFGVAAGLTRLKAVPEWPVEERHVENLYQHLRLSGADNLYEPKDKDWWTELLTKAGKFLMEEEGLKPGQITNRLAKDFGLCRRTIRKLVPAEFKETEKVKAGKIAAEKRAAQTAPVAPTVTESDEIAGPPSTPETIVKEAVDTIPAEIPSVFLDEPPTETPAPQTLGQPVRLPPRPPSAVLPDLFSGLDVKVEFDVPIKLGGKLQVVPSATIDGWLLLDFDGEAFSVRERERVAEALEKKRMKLVRSSKQALENPDVQKLMTQFVVICKALREGR